MSVIYIDVCDNKADCKETKIDEHPYMCDDNKSMNMNMIVPMALNFKKIPLFTINRIVQANTFSWTFNLITINFIITKRTFLMSTADVWGQNTNWWLFTMHHSRAGILLAKLFICPINTVSLAIANSMNWNAIGIWTFIMVGALKLCAMLIFFKILHD